MARQDRIEVHFLELAPPVLDDLSGEHLEALQQLLGQKSLVALDEAHHYVSATLKAALAFVEHVVGLADPRSRPEIDTEVACSLDDGGSVVCRRYLLNLTHAAPSYRGGVGP